MKPILKWAGGKTQLIPVLMPHLQGPGYEDGNYFEPFLGGGAVFCALVSGGHTFQSWTLGDINPELINLYTVVRDSLADLLAGLNGPWDFSEEEYYRMRAEVPSDPVGQAMRTIYLNKTCFNGIYRQNSKGGFNVPYGKRGKVALYEEDNLKEWEWHLKDVTLIQGSYSKTLASADRGDLVYLDPPYAPLNATSSFNAYVAGGFGDEAQTELAAYCRGLVNQGVKVVASNSSAPSVRTLYEGFLEILEVGARRALNSKGDSRGAVAEFLMVNRDASVGEA